MKPLCFPQVGDKWERIPPTLHSPSINHRMYLFRAPCFRNDLNVSSEKWPRPQIYAIYAHMQFVARRCLLCPASWRINVFFINIGKVDVIVVGPVCHIYKIKLEFNIKSGSNCYTRKIQIRNISLIVRNLAFYTTKLALAPRNERKK